ncbi:hypothetical protein O6H91_12G045700 [Diphasiastrum complanatum]|uniref:Uncharacterized protein n=1 Tax=Diphasiastrum complanatum TaxID=34168 RepID=A0ACC2C1A1_DIPCM|nr:hypothetical protein O6H91_12G045700 [Diphasiastrum complanatum]
MFPWLRGKCIVIANLFKLIKTWDFHLWQFFVACLPPLAVYLCAQLIRSDIRQMEKEKEQAKEEREKANLSTEQKLYSSNVQDKDSRTAGRNENLSELPEVLLAFKARLDAMEEKIRLVEIASGESSKALKKEEVKDQIVRAAGNEDLPKSAHGEKKGGIPTNTQQGINSTSQENQTNFQVSSSINDDQKKIEQHTERVSNFWSFWRNKESRKYVEPPEKYQENPSHLPVNTNNMSQILTPQTGARGKTDDLALKKRNSFGANPDMSAVRSGKEERPV